MGEALFQDYSMTSEEIKDTLTSLGYKLGDRGKYWQTSAIFRNGDNQTAIQIYKDTGIWKDYVQQTPFMPFIKLVQMTLGTTDEKILKKYIKEQDNFSFNRKEAVEKLEMEKIYPEESLDKLLPHYKFYNDKGISSDTLRFFKGGLATQGHMYQRFVFPIYNQNSHIHGFSGRDMASAENRPKWKHIGVKSKWVYPLYVPSSSGFPTIDAIEESNEVVLVESIGDLLSLYENGITNVLSIFGLEVSPSLICALVGLSPGKIIISLNNDEDKDENRGLNASVKNYLKLFSHFDYDKIEVCLPIKNDFGDMTSSEFEEWKLKKASIDPIKQRNNIYNLANKLLINNKLPKSFSTKINKLKKIVS